MPLAGVICPFDNSYQDFETCIHAHDYGSPDGRNCHCPVEVLKLMRDNHIGRKHAGWSASTLTSCARQVALEYEYDFYEDVKSGYNKARGEWIHAMMESDPTPKPGVIREKRVRKFVTVDGYQLYLTGKFDKVDSERGILIDYKSKDRIPKKLDPHHEAQFNVYVYLLNGGYYIHADGSKGHQVNIEIKQGGMHYLTFNPKEPFKKVMYPIWDNARIEQFIADRLRPLVRWKEEGIFPSCNAYVRYPGKTWKCGCVKLEQQLQERGIVV